MTYILKFNEQQMQVLNVALGEIPLKLGLPLLQSINEQIGEQRAREDAKNEAIMENR